jgi:hypothetical protein
MKPLLVIETLMRYDVPLIVVAREDTPKDHVAPQMYVCLNIEESDDGLEKFLVTRVPGKEFLRYLQEEVDFRFLLSVKGARHYVTHMSGEVGTIFTPILFNDSIDDHLPDPALFLRGYKGELLKNFQVAASSDCRVLIDGRWGLPDMRRFASLFGNAYSFLYSLRPKDGHVEQRTRALFGKYPWRGGFSAVNFFDQLENLVPRVSRPQIDKMQKASPGFIDFRLDGSISDQVIALVTQINVKNNAPSEAYRTTRQFLKERSWLGNSAADIRLSDGDLSDLNQHVEFMATSLHLEMHIDYIMSLAQRDPLAAVKILLSLFRKVKELADYLATGKAQFAGTNELPVDVEAEV